MPRFDPLYSTGRRLGVGLAIGGFVGGAVFGAVLTRLGKIIADAPPGTLQNYLWNSFVFGVLAAAVSPLVSSLFLRRVPLWRTIAEPLLYAMAGAAAAVVIGVAPLILVLPPLGLVAGFVRLGRRYRGRVALQEPTTTNSRLEAYGE
jgi:hypothetical protein